MPTIPAFPQRIVPVATVGTPETALALIGALKRGGLPVLEVTFRLEGAADAIRAVARKHPDVMIGAGTILTREQLDAAHGAGARFAVSPGLDESLVRHAQELGLPYVPGVATASEVQRALGLGCGMLKLFPADLLNGIKWLQIFTRVFGHTGVRFVPTGGVSAANAADYLALPIVGAIGGSWMVTGDLVESGAWDQITAMTKEAVELAAAAVG